MSIDNIGRTTYEISPSFSEHERKVIGLLTTGSFSRPEIIKKLKLHKSTVFDIVDRLEIAKKIEVDPSTASKTRGKKYRVVKTLETKIDEVKELIKEKNTEPQPVVDDAKFQDDIRKSIRGILSKAVFFYNRLYLPDLWNNYTLRPTSKSILLWKLMESYNSTDPVKFDRKERLLELVSNDIGESKDDIRKAFQKVYSSFVIYALPDEDENEYYEDEE